VKVKKGIQKALNLLIFDGIECDEEIFTDQKREIIFVWWGRAIGKSEVWITKRTKNLYGSLSDIMGAKKMARYGSV